LYKKTRAKNVDEINTCCILKSVHRFGRAKFPDGGLVLGSSQFSMLPQLPQKMLLDLKVVKN